jgi:hypothetical protein
MKATDLGLGLLITFNVPLLRRAFAGWSELADSHLAVWRFIQDQDHATR